MNKKTMMAVVAVVLVLGAVSIILLRDKAEVSMNETPTPSPVATATPAEEIKVFEVSASNFKFSVTEIRVNEGDRVRINFNNGEGFHDWVLDEFNGAKTAQLQAGQAASVEFIADKKGTFEYYCSVGKHREMGMVGKFIVE